MAVNESHFQVSGEASRGKVGITRPACREIFQERNMQFYTVKQVAGILHISERAVESLLKRHELAYVDVCTSPSGKKPRKRISEMDLQMFLDSRRTESRKERNIRLERRRKKMK